MTSRNQREGPYGGWWKGHHYRSEGSLKELVKDNKWIKTPEGISWMNELNKFKIDNSSSSKPDFSKFVTFKDYIEALDIWKKNSLETLNELTKLSQEMGLYD